MFSYKLISLRLFIENIEVLDGTIESEGTTAEIVNAIRFQFHEVQLRVKTFKQFTLYIQSFNSTRYNWECLGNCAITRFKRVSIPRGTIESRRCEEHSRCIGMFQFHEVQLRAMGVDTLAGIYAGFNSTRYNWEKKITIIYRFVFWVSIPRGTIERKELIVTCHESNWFQFHEVQLRDNTKQQDVSVYPSFNSTRYNWELCKYPFGC